MIERLVYGLLLIASGSMPSKPVEELVVRGSAAQPAIERILNADNLEVDRLSPREVADTMAEISRGRAPADFWTSYQKHVRAWQDYANARDAARVVTSATDIDHRPDGLAIADARKRINTTFDEVEAVTRRYHARMPASSTRF